MEGSNKNCINDCMNNRIESFAFEVVWTSMMSTIKSIKKMLKINPDNPIDIKNIGHAKTIFQISSAFTYGRQKPPSPRSMATWAKLHEFKYGLLPLSKLFPNLFSNLKTIFQGKRVIKGISTVLLIHVNPP